MAKRVRRTNEVIQGQREAAAVAGTLGGVVRTGRRDKRLSLADLGARVGLSRTRIAEIERGEGIGAPLETWVTLGIALDRPLAVSFSRPLEPRGPADAGHLEIQERVLGLARTTRRHGTFELPTRPASPARSTDVGLRDDRHRALIQVECWNTFGDLGAAIRATKRKAAEAAAHAFATIVGDADPYRVATVWVVRATAGNRSLLGRYPHILDTAFPGSSRRWCGALTDGAEPPAEPGIVWFDPATHRLTEHRRAHRVGKIR
jgi:transcriptional regulator with XRE-family HTH domain